MTMDYSFCKTLEELKGEKNSVVVFIEKGQRVLPREARELPEEARGAVTNFLASADFKGEMGEVGAVYPTGLLRRASGAPRNDNATKRVVLVGIGERKSFDTGTAWKVVAAASQWVQNKKQDAFTLMLPAWFVTKFKPEPLGVLIAKAVAMGTYHFDQYKTDPERKSPAIKQVALFGVEGRYRRAFERGLTAGQILADAINHVRDLGNLPPIEMTPTYLAKEAEKLGKQYPKLKVTVLGREEMKKLGMGALLGVAAGSVQPPAFIVLEWTGGAKTKKPIVFVGKGITFDSGGISIKPGEQMDEMKYDMCGAAAVLGAMRVIAAMNIKNNVVGLMPATENLPSGSAYRPGDILRTMGGKTIEVLNTDAEGRLILADALCYAKKYEPRAVVDLATLTGACAFFMGPWHAGLFSDNEDVARRVVGAAEMAGEGVWRLPLLPDHTKAVKSEIADVKNIGGKISGAATAAAFLKEFTSYPWAHLDIAGTAWTWNMKSEPWMRAGATGYGVHLLVELAKEWR